MNHTEFGRYLSRQRELRGLSRAEISKITKISPALLEALEDGEVRRLPSRVFVIQYVRAYAEVIGLAPDDAVLRYEEVEPLPAPPEPATAARPKPPTLNPFPKRQVLIAAAAALLLLVLFMLFGPHGSR